MLLTTTKQNISRSKKNWRRMITLEGAFSKHQKGVSGHHQEARCLLKYNKVKKGVLRKGCVQGLSMDCRSGRSTVSKSLLWKYNKHLQLIRLRKQMKSFGKLKLKLQLLWEIQSCCEHSQTLFNIVFFFVHNLE